MNYDQPTWERLIRIVDHVERGPLLHTKAEIHRALTRAGATRIRINRWRGGCRYTIHYRDTESTTQFIVCEPLTFGRGFAPRRKPAHEGRSNA